MDSKHEQASDEASVVSISGTEAESEASSSTAVQLSSKQFVACATSGTTTGNASNAELTALWGKWDDLVKTLMNLEKKLGRLVLFILTTSVSHSQQSSWSVIKQQQCVCQYI